MEIGWTNPVRNVVVLCRVNVERGILRTVKRRKANCIGNVLHMNCFFLNALLKERYVTGRRGRRRKQTLRKGEDTVN